MEVTAFHVVPVLEDSESEKLSSDHMSSKTVSVAGLHVETTVEAGDDPGALWEPCWPRRAKNDLGIAGFLTHM